MGALLIKIIIVIMACFIDMINILYNSENSFSDINSFFLTPQKFLLMYAYPKSIGGEVMEIYTNSVSLLFNKP